MTADPRTQLADSSTRLFARIADAIRLYETLPAATRHAIEQRVKAGAK